MKENKNIFHERMRLVPNESENHNHNQNMAYDLMRKRFLCVYPRLEFLSSVTERLMPPGVGGLMQGSPETPRYYIAVMHVLGSRGGH